MLFEIIFCFVWLVHSDLFVIAKCVKEKSVGQIPDEGNPPRVRFARQGFRPGTGREMLAPSLTGCLKRTGGNAFALVTVQIDIFQTLTILEGSVDALPPHARIVH